MRKFLGLILALAMLMTLTACQKKDAETPENPAPPQQTEPAETPEIQLRDLEAVAVNAEVAEGRIPGGEYVLPEKQVSMVQWLEQGALCLLVQTEEVSLYGVESKDSYPALLRWGDSMEEFDWLYVTPQALEPELWLMDHDGDGETELVADCYGGSGTGVSMEYIYIVEKDADGRLVSHELPWSDLCDQVDRQFQMAAMNDSVYAALGKELVEITDRIPEGAEAERVCLGWIAGYTPAEGGLNGTFGVMVEGTGIQGPVYVADVEGFIRYEDGVFTLEKLHLLSN
jgi:hypothetical protein